LAYAFSSGLDADRQVFGKKMTHLPLRATGGLSRETVGEQRQLEPSVQLRHHRGEITIPFSERLLPCAQEEFFL
jgi:hypothetical protein